MDPALLDYARSTGNVSRCIEDALRQMVERAAGSHPLIQEKLQ